MNKVVVRAISGTVYMAIIIGCILLGVNAVTILALVLCALGIIEFYKITGGLDKRTPDTILIDYAGAAALILGCYRTEILLVWPAILLIRFVEELYLKEPNPLYSLGRSVFSQVYFGFPLGLLQNLETYNNGGTWGHGYCLLAIFVFIWLNDTGAFCVGSMCGKHKLFERISPKKTWEGFFGGLVCNIGASILFCFCFSSNFAMPENIVMWIGLAVTITVFATWGDLLESLIKRTYNVKDSGHWIPGHGGILDRIDSLLFVAPASAIYLQFFHSIFSC